VVLKHLHIECSGVRTLMIPQDVQAASNQVSERVLQHQLNMKDVTNSTADPDSGSHSSNRSWICSSRSSSSHSDDMENGSYARLMDMHIVVQVISSIPLIIGFTLLTFLVVLSIVRRSEDM